MWITVDGATITYIIGSPYLPQFLPLVVPFLGLPQLQLQILGPLPLLALLALLLLHLNLLPLELHPCQPKHIYILCFWYVGQNPLLVNCAYRFHHSSPVARPQLCEHHVPRVLLLQRQGADRIHRNHCPFGIQKDIMLGVVHDLGRVIVEPDAKSLPQQRPYVFGR